MILTLYINDEIVEAIDLKKTLHLTPAKVIAYLKNKHSERMWDCRWEIIMTVMSKMHRVIINDYKIKKEIEKREMQISKKDTVKIERPKAEYTNTNYVDKYLNQAS